MTVNMDAMWRDTAEAFDTFPIPLSEKIKHLGLFETPLTVQRLLFFDRLMAMVENIKGSVWLFGLTYGRDFVLFQNLQTVYGRRNMLGFDTFEGHVGSDPTRDGPDEYAQDGAFSVGMEVAAQFWRLALNFHKTIGGGSINLVPGDVRQTLPKLVVERPWELVALAYLDMDLYEPTKVALETVWARMPVGGVVGFDELSDTKYPGETIAMLEVLGTPRVQTFPWCSMSYVVKG